MPNLNTYHSLYSGRKEHVDSTRVQISTVSQELRMGLTVIADSGNAGLIYVGNSGVLAGTADDSCGFPLKADAAITIPIDDVSKVYAVASASESGTLYWTAL